MLSVAGTKAVALVCMMLITLAFAMLPLYVRNLLKGRLKGKKAQDALSACLCFGGGVLMATVFLHLIPEARLVTQRCFDNHFIPHTGYPIAELIVCIGFFIIYVVEHVVHTCSEHNHHSPLGEESKEKKNPDILGEESVPLKQVPKDLGKEDGLDKTHRNSAENSDPENNQKETESVPGDSANTVKEGMPTFKAMIFVVAFSFHSIMEGLALGLVDSNRAVWFLFAALLAHKIVIAFCMAMELLEVGVSLCGFLASMIIFAVASPLGGMMGTLIVSLASNESAGGMITTMILQGISAGTILYVTFCEVLERERAKPEGATTRMISLMLGFSAMAILQIFDDEALIQPQRHFHNVTSEISAYAANNTL